MVKKTAVIDGDLLSYRSAFAYQKSYVTLEYNGIDYGRFENKTTAHTYMSSLGHTDMVNSCIITPGVETLSLKQCLSYVDKTIRSICKRAGCQNYVVYVDGQGNFRSKLATVQKYKDRDQPKPVHLAAVKKYLVEKHKAIVVERIEADDAISIMTYKGYQLSGGDPDKCPVVACTYDKDAKNTPGLLLNWYADDTEVVWITPLEALRSFYKQVLTGDPVDTYRGCRGVGERSPHLRKIDKMTTEQEMYDYCLSIYQETEKKAQEQREHKAGKLKDDLPVEDVEAEMLEMCRLAYMLREKPKYDAEGNITDLWLPPHQRQEST